MEATYVNTNMPCLGNEYLWLFFNLEGLSD